MTTTVAGYPLPPSSEEDQPDDADDSPRINGALEPDLLVFRKHNFDGAPHEPDMIPAVDAEGPITAAVEVIMKQGFVWDSEFRSAIVAAISELIPVRPNQISVAFGTSSTEIRIIPAPAQLPSTIKASLSNALLSGKLLEKLQSAEVPCSKVIVIDYPSEKDHGHRASYGSDPSDPHKFFTTFSYLVRSGETILSISQKFGIRPSLLVAFNEKVADPIMLKAGDTLLIPRPRGVQVKRVSPLFSELAGGDDVVISGMGFVAPTFCKFGAIIAQATYVVENMIICPSPEQKEPGSYPLYVSDGRGGYVTANVTYSYSAEVLPFCDGDESEGCRPRLQIGDVSPLRAPANVPLVVHVHGQGFNTSTVCQVAGVDVETKVTSRTDLTCSLRAMNPSTVPLILHHGSHSTKAVDLVFFSTLDFASIAPLYGPDHGNTQVSIKGTSFEAGTKCLFDDEIVLAEFVSSSELRCASPPHQSGVVQVSVELPSGLQAPNSLPFEYTHLELTKMSSVSGSVHGGDDITLEGHGFYPQMFCRFGSNIVDAQFINLTHIVCVSPAQQVSGNVVVQVSLNGKDWSAQELSYFYIERISKAEPTNGPSLGGTLVTISGQGFDQLCAYVCRFGAVPVPAMRVNASRLQCFSPPGKGSVQLVVEAKEIRLRNQPINDIFTFVYNGDHSIFELVPAFTDVRVSNESVEVRGSNFVSGMLCRFGAESSLSIFRNDKKIECIAPMRDLAEVVPVSLSYDGGRTWSAVIASFEYRPIIQRIDPVIGRVHGGNVVQVTGYGFNFRTSLCVFGNQVIPARVSNHYQVECQAPKSLVPGKVRFTVIANESALYDPDLNIAFGHPNSWGIWYTYSLSPDFFVTTVDPISGSTFGGEIVTVTGEGFGHNSYCNFGGSVIVAEFLDALTLRCPTPAHAPGTVDLKIINFNATTGYNVTRKAGSFFFHSPEVSTVEPHEGPVTGGQIVTISGSHLLGATFCKFGRDLMKVVKVSNTEVQCNSPAASISSTVVVDLVFKTVTTTSNLRYTFLPSVTSMSPENALVLTSHQKLVFQGVGFSGLPVICSFDDKDHLPVTIESNSEVVCVAPVSDHPRSTSVKLLHSDLKPLAGNGPFVLRYNPLIQEVHPTFGPTSGGTTITVVGAGFLNITHCKFDELSILAERVSDSMVRCKSPSHPSGRSLIRVTSNTFQSNSAEFSFRVMSAQVDSVHPTKGSVGGGTLVVIRGSGFSMSSYCKFGDVEVPVIYYATDHVACFSPKIGGTRVVTLEVSQSGGDNGYSANGKLFTYVDGISSVSRLDPSIASEGDMISVIGSSFTKSSKCFFGGRESPTVQFFSEEEIRCEVPKQGSRTQEIVQVAENSTQLPGGHVTFNYATPLSDTTTISVREVTPNIGTTAGGTFVVVRGISFPQRALCRFGDTLVQAVIISSTELHCVTPTHRAVTVALEVLSEDQGQFSSSAIQFTFRDSKASDELDLADSAPAAIPEISELNPGIAAPGETITLTGQRFSSSGFCIFFNQISNLQVPAKVIDSAHVACELPAQISRLGVRPFVRYLSIGGTSSEPRQLEIIIT
eukprot:c21668_g1_i1.p1 GENE.c21668_g1_i1~~c21668_g1_i1.p1  ORF type:complete len:1594 (-),score=270.87 c21668_g1_i1:45-4733(-)